MSELRIIRISAALLYAGPLLAGLAAHSLWSLPLFLTAFLSWQMLRHPGAWPEHAGDWLAPETVAPALMLIFSQLLFVLLLLSAGRGIGAMLGAEPAFGEGGPLFLAAAGLLCLRYAPRLALLPRLSRS